MRLIPPNVFKFSSNAEKKIFRLCKGVESADNQSCILHSLNVSEHDYKVWSELDFVYVCPKGILVLEVKGGRIACEDGIWFYKDRYGVSHKSSEGPISQAKSAHYALIDMLGQTLTASEIAKISSGWGVVFPDIDYSVKSVEIPADIVADQKSCVASKSFLKFLDHACGYWFNKKKAHELLDAETIGKIIKAFRPSFEVVPNLVSLTETIQKELVRLTDEQYRIVDSISENERLIISGGAGTGKTFVALEKARRDVFNQKSVLFVTSGSLLESYCRLQTVNLEGDIKILDWATLKEAAISTVQYDVLFVDEGQDCLDLDTLDLLDRLLKNGLENGVWRWFMDENAQAGLRGKFDNTAFDYLKSFQPVPARLKHNCRNTEEIILETENATGAYIGETTVKGAGLGVTYDFSSNAALSLETKIDEWLNSGASLQDIVILSPCPLHQSIVSDVSDSLKKKIASISDNSLTEVPDPAIDFCTVQEFKGLERKFVALVDGDIIARSELADTLLYVAYTRSHAQVWVSGGKELKKYIERQRKKHASKIVERLKKG